MLTVSTGALAGAFLLTVLYSTVRAHAVLRSRSQISSGFFFGCMEPGPNLTNFYFLQIFIKRLRQKKNTFCAESLSRRDIKYPEPPKKRGRLRTTAYMFFFIKDYNYI